MFFGYGISDPLFDRQRAMQFPTYFDSGIVSPVICATAHLARGFAGFFSGESIPN